MPITYPLTFPTSGVSGVVIGMRSIVGVTRSPFTGQEQVQVHQGRLWELAAEYPPRNRANAQPVIAFLAKLNGREGTFLAGDPDGAIPRGAPDGTPLVNGAAQVGVDLVIDGAVTLRVNWLREGDYISLGTGVRTHLHKVLDDANSDAGGNVTLTIWPPLRESPGDGDPVTVTNAKGHFRLVDNLSEFSISTSKFYGVSFQAVEALEII